MRLAAYQFNVSGNVDLNMSAVESAVIKAAGLGAGLIVFPECALTGYPPRNMADSRAVDIALLSEKLMRLQSISDKYNISIIIGTITYNEKYYNSACFISPGQPMDKYDKRALYGWDADNFTKGIRAGVFKTGEYTLGVRICYEVRFPEYFRELYLAKTDLNIVLFDDVSGTDDTVRYHMMGSHLITRAVENVTPILSVNVSSPYQTAPTCFIDASGKILCEVERNEDGMLLYDFEKKELNFGEIGRKQESDRLLKNMILWRNL